MTLNPIPSFPSQRCYVVRLHADVQPGGALSGRLEHVNSGDGFNFKTAEELLQLLQQHAAPPAPPAETA